MENIVYPKLKTSRRLPNGDVEEIYYRVTLETCAMDTMARKAADNASWKSQDGPARIMVLATQKIPKK